MSNRTFYTVGIILPFMRNLPSILPPASRPIESKVTMTRVTAQGQALDEGIGLVYCVSGPAFLGQRLAAAALEPPCHRRVFLESTT